MIYQPGFYFQILMDNKNLDSFISIQLQSLF